MKTKFKKNGRRFLAAILCLVMAVMALPLSAFAWTSEEGVSCTSSFGDYYVGSDGGYYRSKSSYSFIVYDSDGNTSVRTISAGNAKRKYLMTDSGGTHQVYCVESGIDFNTGNSYVSQNGKNSSYFRKLPTEAQFGVMMALMYGWHEGKSSPVAGSAPTEIGSYRGFRMEIYYDTVNAHYCMNLCGKAKHKVDLGSDALGNLTRIENELSKLLARLEAAKTKKAETIAQLEIAKEEIKKPFAFEDELKEKTERLNTLNIELNLNEKDTSVMDTESEQTEEQPERKCASRER